jgi:hypothetical protein
MKKGYVTEVKKVFGNESGFHQVIKLTISEDMVRTVQAQNRWHQGLVRRRCVSHPNPYPTVLLNNWICANS